MSINNLIVDGRLARDPEIKKTPAGDSVCELALAISDGYGEKRKTIWLDVTLWKGTADYVADNARKGTAIAVSGKLTQDHWEDKKTGSKRSKIGMTGFSVLIGAHSGEGGGNGNGGSSGNSGSLANSQFAPDPNPPTPPPAPAQPSLGKTPEGDEIPF